MDEFSFISKSDELLKNSIWKVYGKKCFYCGQMINVHQLEVDHIVPKKPEELIDNNEWKELLNYIDSLNKEGFIKDCIMNYLPSCGHCNKQKNNKYFTVGNLRYFHEQARRKAKKVFIEYGKSKYKKPNYLDGKRYDELIEKMKKDNELYKKKVVIDGYNETYYAFGLGKVRVDALLPVNFETQISCCIRVEAVEICNCQFFFNEEEVTGLLFSGYKADSTRYRKFIWFLNGEEKGLDFGHCKFESDKETTDQLCEILDDLYSEYDNRKNQLENTVRGRKFEKVGRGRFKLILLPKSIWYKMYGFAQNHDYYTGKDKWDIFSPFHSMQRDRIRIYNNKKLSGIDADILVELVVNNINEDYVDILWETGYTDYIQDKMDGFDDIHKWTVEYTHDWILYEWIPYIFFINELEKYNWIKRKLSRIPTFTQYKSTFNIAQYDIQSYKME